MCVKFEYEDKHVVDFDQEKDLKSQIAGLKTISVNYRSNQDKKEVSQLISQLKSILSISVLNPFSIKYNCNDILSGAKLARELRKIEKENTKAFVVSKTITMHSDFVKGLDDILEDLNKK